MLTKIKDIFKKYFIAGILVFVPVWITVLVITLLLGWSDIILNILPKPINPKTYLPIPGLGLLLTILLILGAGVLVRNYVGKRLLSRGEAILDRIPLIRSVYQASKKFTEAVLSPEKSGFRRVALVEYPRKGVYCVGFITGVTEGEVQEKTQEKVVNVFIPTTPNPTSGFYVLIPEKDIIPLTMSVEDAFKLIMSGGLVTPPSSQFQGEV